MKNQKNSILEKLMLKNIDFKIKQNREPIIIIIHPKTILDLYKEIKSKYNGVRINNNKIYLYHLNTIDIIYNKYDPIKSGCLIYIHGMKIYQTLDIEEGNIKLF